MITAVFILVILALKDMLPLFKEKEKKIKDIISCVAIFILTLIFTVLVTSGVKIPSPMLLLDKLFKSVGLSY